MLSMKKKINFRYHLLNWICASFLFSGLCLLSYAIISCGFFYFFSSLSYYYLLRKEQQTIELSPAALLVATKQNNNNNNKYPNNCLLDFMFFIFLTICILIPWLHFQFDSFSQLCLNESSDDRGSKRVLTFFFLIFIICFRSKIKWYWIELHQWQIAINQSTEERWRHVRANFFFAANYYIWIKYLMFEMDLIDKFKSTPSKW